jgi:ABC-type antimicrobial peptide transport system permease subunit
MDILTYLNREHLVLLLIASLISWPAGYWLYANFPGPYKFPLQIWVFILPTALVMVIAVLTTLYFNLVASRTNPSDVLRYE